MNYTEASIYIVILLKVKKYENKEFPFDKIAVSNEIRLLLLSELTPASF